MLRASDSIWMKSQESGKHHLRVVSGENPKHEKNSARKAFSFVPTRPVAGEALRLTLRERTNQETTWKDLLVKI